MSINHLFQDTVVFSNERRNIDPTSLLNFTISTVSDNTYYNLYDSYITLDLQGKVSKSSDVVSAANQKFRIKTNFQPAGMISASRANYTYINTNGDLVTQELNTSSEYTGASRTVIDQLFTPKRIHDQDSGFLENAYHSSGSVIFDNFIYFMADNQGDNPCNITAKIRIPYRSCIECANTQSFVNIKSLEVSLKLLDKKDFFMFNKATNKYKIYKNDGSENEAAITELYITKCELHNSIWIGEGDSLIQPMLRELSNVTIATKNIILNKDKTTYDDNIIVNFAPKYMICYFTDMDRNHAQLLNIKPSYFRVAVAGGAQSTKVNFDNTFLEKDSAYWDMVNYCCNTLREQSLVTYNRWQEALHYFVFPLGELFSFKASNIIQLNLIFPALTQGCVLNVIFIKDSTA